ncbi:hypothetical protein ACTMU2_16065 [Cupriavidus basilensis]
MTNEELAAKFARNAEGVISERNVDQFINGLWKLESMVDVRELFLLAAKP